MKRLASLVAVFGSSFLFACGVADTGAKLGGGKEGAASAVFTASQASLAQDGFLDGMTNGAEPTGFTRSCPQGGSVVVAIDPTEGARGFEASYMGCNVDGETKLGGKAKLSLITEKVGGGWAASVIFTGKLDLTGAISDTLEFDVTQTASVATLRTQDSSVTFTMRGFAKTTTAEYDFVNEPMTLTPGKLTAAPVMTDRNSRN
jgi:hypothetical protein